MEFLIFIGVVGVIFLLSKIRKGEGVGEQLNYGLEERIRMNEMKAMETMQTGGVDERPESHGKSATEESAGPVNLDTFGLVHTILQELGCQPQKDEDGGLNVKYQGENFVINTGGAYAQIWDLGWGNMNIKDPNFEKLRNAVNGSNFEWGPAIVFTNPDEEGTVWLHSKMDVLVLPVIPDRNEYFRSLLNSFFDKKENVRVRFNSLINMQQQSPKPHRPVGFATDTEIS